MEEWQIEEATPALGASQQVARLTPIRMIKSLP
jgi:hypothetical protein